jgi:hypothetical protein
MAETSLAKKLNIKPGQRIVVFNAPDGYLEQLQPLPEGTQMATAAAPGEQFDVVQLFVKSVSELDAQATNAVAALKPGGLLWCAYPKKSSAIKTDISRDVGWDALREAGFLVVSAVAIDDTWSALRFRPREEIKTLTRKEREQNS